MTLRTTPVQARSAARIAELLDACAESIDEVGVEQVTTNLVADKAGSSIGTLYRYFPDRMAVIRALGLRQTAELCGHISRIVKDLDGSEAAFSEVLKHLEDEFVTWYRKTKGAPALTYAHLLDLPVTEVEARVSDNVLPAGKTPREVMVGYVAEHFMAAGELREAMRRDLDFLTVTAFSFVDRAGALGRAGQDVEASYEWATECIRAASGYFRIRFIELQKAAAAGTGAPPWLDPESFYGKSH